MLQAVLLAALAVPLQSGAAPEPVAPLRGEHWFELANRLEFELRFDESIIARIEGLRLDDDEQGRRELARQLQHVAGRVATIRPRVPLESQDDPISWSVVGDRIAIHSDRIRVHDAVTGATLFTSRNNDRCKRDSVISLSPDGHLIVHNSPTWSRVAASVEDIESGETVFQLDEYLQLLGAAWSPDVQRLALVLDSKESGPRVQVRALPGFELVRSFDLGDFVPHDASFSHDGDWLAVRGDFALRVWSISTGLAVEKLSGPIGTSALGWHPLEARLALGLHRDVNPWIFDLVDDAWEMVPGAKIDRGPGHEITFDRERDRWVEVTEFRLGTFRDGADGAMPNLVHEDEVIEYLGSRLVRDVALSPDGGLAVRRTNSNVYSVWDTRTGHLIPARIQYDDWRARVRFAGPDRIALMEPSGLVRVLDPHADHGGRSLPQPSIYRHENLSPWIGEGSRRGLYVRRMSEVSIESIDGTRTLVGRHGGSLDALVPSPGAELLAAHNGAGSIVVWDLAHPGRAPVSSQSTPFLRSVGFTPSGERLLTTSLSSPVGLWDPRTLELRGTLDRVDVDRADAALPYIDGRKLATNPELPNEVTLTWDEFHALDDEYNPIVSSSGAGYLIADITETVVEWVDVDGSTVDLAAIVPVDDAPEAQWLDAVVHRDRVLVLADGTTYLIDPRMPGIVAAYEGEFTGAGGGAATIRTGSEVRLVRLVDGADLGRFEAGEDVAAVAPIDAARVAMLRRLDELRAVDIARGGEGVAVEISTTEIADIVVTPGEFAAVKLHSGEAIRVNLVTGDTSAATSEFLEEADVSRGARSWSKWVDIDPVDAERLPPHVRIALLNDDALGLPTRINENGIAAFERERFARIDTEGLTPIGARRIPVGIWGLSNGSSDRGFFGDDLFLMAWTQTESGFTPIVLEVGPSSMAPAGGDPGGLMKEWSQRLSLRVTAEGRIERITYEPR